MTTRQQLQDALTHAIRGALHDTLPVSIRPEVVCLDDPALAVGNVQILIRVGMGVPDSTPAEIAQPAPALTE